MVTISCNNVKFTQIEAIIFDKDGTLADSHHFLRELALKRARMIDAQIPGVGEPLLMAFGLEDGTLNPTGLMAVGSRLENELVAAGYIAETGRSWLESLAIARKAFQEADQLLPDRAKTSPLFAGCLGVIKSLAEAGLKLGILSADSTEAVLKFAEFNQLSRYFSLQMGVDGSLIKPDPGLFFQACNLLGVEPQATLMIGDSPGDIYMAKQAGAAGVIGICWGNSESLHLRDADVAISQLDMLTLS
jgi:phosphoglycolate phosphatase